MNKKLATFYKGRMTSDEFKNLSAYSEKFTNIEQIAINLKDYMPPQIPSENGFDCLASEILVTALVAYEDCSGDISDKYRSFLFAIIVNIKKVLRYGVSDADKRNIHSRGTYWDCLKESYTDWSTRNNVNEPLVETTSLKIENQSLSIGVALISFVIDRSDWSFIGIPHAGDSSERTGNNDIDKLIMLSKSA